MADVTDQLESEDTYSDDSVVLPKRLQGDSNSLRFDRHDMISAETGEITATSCGSVSREPFVSAVGESEILEAPPWLPFPDEKPAVNEVLQFVMFRRRSLELPKDFFDVHQRTELQRLILTEMVMLRTLTIAFRLSAGNVEATVGLLKEELAKQGERMSRSALYLTMKELGVSTDTFRAGEATVDEVIRASSSVQKNIAKLNELSGKSSYGMIKDSTRTKS